MKKETIENRVVLKADEGMVLVNGKVCGKEIFLAEGVLGDGFCEITVEEYQARIKAEESEQATE